MSINNTWVFFWLLIVAPNRRYSCDPRLETSLAIMDQTAFFTYILRSILFFARIKPKQQGIHTESGTQKYPSNKTQDLYLDVQEKPLMLGSFLSRVKVSLTLSSIL
jgi:hypothetical protein